MDDYQKIIYSKQYTLTDTAFNLLMQKRIYKILLICSNYDAYMLEEDGRIDEQIFNEYVSLSLRYPPTFIQANTVNDAFRILEEEKIDLVITMLSIDEIDAFMLAKKIKSTYSQIPIVVLTPFSREVSLRLEKEDLSAIDYVFCWLGNADLLLAIIKLIEDKMNLLHDVEEVGVQAIILVEDSIRYYSSYLPTIYRIVLQQSKRSMTEGVNEHQRTLRMRGRPKILLATNYEHATELYDKYKRNILGVISDISYKREGKLDKLAGVKLCKMIKKDDPHMPFLLQSSNVDNQKYAQEIGVGFVHKYSKTLSIEIRNYLIRHLAFGDFAFRMPDTLKEINRAIDLKSLQEKILKIPDESIEFHAQRNDFSKWMNARALFPIAQLFKYITLDNFKQLSDARVFIFDVIAMYRRNSGKGVIAKFDKKSFDEYLMFSRIGEGSIGGKARGLAFIDSFLKKHSVFEQVEDVSITIPRTVVLTTEIFDEFMEENDLYSVALSDISDDEILNHFIEAKLPKQINEDLMAYLSVVKNPIAVRSSSKLEDSHYQPFAGMYSTYMLPNIRTNLSLTKKTLSEAIKSVYASVFYKNSKSYMTATSNVIDEEKMGIVLQEVCGSQYMNRFQPTFSGVARSINFYPIEPEKPEEGIANIAFGLGKFIVDGGMSLRFSPKYPKKILQLSSPEMTLRDTQKYFYALDLKEESFVPSIDDGVNILKLDIKDAEQDNSLKHVASTYDFHNNVIRDGVNYEGKKLITFANILKHNVFPLADILHNLLDIGQREMNNPVEIEFAVNLEVPKGEPKTFNVLQIRPIVDNKEVIDFNLDDVNYESAIITSNSALGNGTISGLHDFIYIKPGAFDPAKSSMIADEMEKVNAKFIEEKKNYVLVGPGRWGSSDPWLGIPVKWAQISAARVIIESGLENFRIDPSQGTHFFQNLTSFRVGYFTINPFIKDGHYDLEFLAGQKAYYEDEFIRHIRFETPMVVKIDGKRNKGVVFKPNGSK